ncbi:MAG: beta-lactamase family protein [Actinomycetia bacterium]|nr:beta-lactamase family protein [Actinomycetes bacterium]
MQSRIDGATSWALQWQARRRVPGMALVITDRNQTLHVELSGLADRDGMRPVDAAQRWQIGSISKAFTSIAVLQLQSRGELSTDDQVIDLLPWASHLHPDITLHHLMTHTAGLPGGSEWTPDSLLESAMQGAVGTPQAPGGPFWYSNPGYELIGDVVESITGQPLENYLEEQVLRPLGMSHSAASVVTTDHGADVRGHRPPQDDALWQAATDQTPDVLFPTCTADGAIAATPEDMGHYLRFLLNSGAESVLGPDDFARLSGRHVRDDDGWYGYGLRTHEHDSQVTLGHSGGMVGMFAEAQVDLDRGVGTCMLVNGYADDSEANKHVLRLLCDLPTDEPSWPRPEPLDDGSHHPYRAAVGLYRSYNPWASTLRILHAEGELRLADPVSGSFEVLHPESQSRFRVGRVDSPDVVDVSVEIGGSFQRLDLSGCPYGRARRDRAADR